MSGTHEPRLCANDCRLGRKEERRKGEHATYAQDLYQVDLPAGPDHVVLVLVPVLEEQGVQLVGLRRLGARQEELDDRVAFVLPLQLEGVASMVHPRPDATLVFAGQQHALDPLELDRELALGRLDVLVLVGVEVDERLVREVLRAFR